MKEVKAFYLKKWNERQKSPKLAWVKDLQKRAWERFEQTPLPSGNEEEWRKTDVSPLLKREFQPPSFDETKKDILRLEKKQGLVFLNGKLANMPEVSQGLQVLSLSNLPSTEEVLFQPYLGSVPALNSNAFTAWNTAFFEDAALVYVPKGMVVQKPLEIFFITETLDEALMTAPRVLVVVEENAELKILERYLGRGIYFTNAVTEIILKEGAILKHYKMEEEGRESFHISNTVFLQERESNLFSFSLALGGGFVRNDVDVYLEDEGANCTLDGLYVVSGKQHVDHHTLIDHRKPHCTSREFYKGILGESAHAVFDGKIIVRPGAQKTDASQTNKNLILSDSAIVDTNPRLEIKADDVKCAHGATIGRLDEDCLFYLRSRGMNRKEAANLLTRAFANDMVGRIPDVNVKEEISAKVQTKIASMELE